MNSFISWVGGKKLLRKTILSMMPKAYDRYIEVFGGAGWVLFGREFDSKVMEVFNDNDSDLVNLWRCVKHHPAELERELQWLLLSRETFKDTLTQMSAEGLTDIQRAARYFYLIKASFGSTRRTFATAPRAFANSIDYLSEVHQRLEKVVIEHKDFADLIKVYDRPTALFYLDPPYYEAEKYYNGEFTPSDHERLKQTLDNVIGKWILSYNDCEYIRNLYRNYNITAVKRHNNLATGARDKAYGEVIIRNYDI